MAYQYQQPNRPMGNGSADLTNLGYTFPGTGNSGALWNSTPPPQAPAPSTPGVGGAPDPFLLSIMNKQQTGNDAARAQNKANWNSSKDYELGLPGQYQGQASTGAAQGLVSQLAANPLSLSPEIVQAMKNRSNNQIQAGFDNSQKQQQGMLAAGGQTDASTLAALKSQSDRLNIGRQATNSTDIDIAAAKQRTTDLANAAGVAGAQSQRDIMPGLTAGGEVLGHLPQVKPDDYTGLLALSGQNQFQNALLSQNAMNMNQGNTLRTPTAFNPIGGSYSQAQGQTPLGNGGALFPQSGGGLTPTDTSAMGGGNLNTTLPGTLGPNTSNIAPQMTSNNYFQNGQKDGTTQKDWDEENGAGGLKPFNLGS